MIRDVKKQGGRVVDLRTPSYWRRTSYLRDPDEGLPSPRPDPNHILDTQALTKGESDIPLTETVPLFDAANCFVLNKHVVVYLVSISANRKGAEVPMRVGFRVRQERRQGSSKCVIVPFRP